MALTMRAPRTLTRSGALTACLVALAVMCVLSLALGTRDIAPGAVARALVDPDAPFAGTIRGLRVPRTLTALAAGVALGLAGTVMQGITRNPLADPGLLGVSAGSAFAVCLGIYLFDVRTPGGYVWLALLGALVSSVVVFAVATTGPRSRSGVTVVLAGTAVSAFLVAATSALVLLDSETLDAFRFWSVGSIARGKLDVLGTLWPFLAVGAVAAAWNSVGLNSLSLGDDVARSLGQRVALDRIIGLVAVTLLTGAAVAACGPITFVGLVVPHLARVLCGPDHRISVPAASLLGGAMVVLADAVGRIIDRPDEVQMGIVLAVVGAPVLVLLARSRRAGQR